MNPRPRSSPAQEVRGFARTSWVLSTPVSRLVSSWWPMVYLERASGSDVARRFLSGALWSVTGGLVTRAVTLGASVVLARVLGQVAFGELGVIQSTVGMFGSLAGFGLGVTATKHLAELRQTDPSRAGRILALSTRFSFVASGGAALVLAAAGPWLAERSLSAPHLGRAVQVAAILLFAMGVSGAQLGALAGLEAFRALAVVSVFQAVVTAPLTVLGARLGGVEGVVWSMCLGLFASCFVGYRAVRLATERAGLPSRSTGWGQEASVLWHFSLPAALSGALVGPVNWACAAFLVNQPGGYAEMGVFNAANQWYMGLMFLPSLLGQAVLPLMSQQLGLGSKERTGHLMVRAMILNLLVVAALLLPLSAFSPQIMKLYGKSFEGRWIPLLISVVTALLVAAQAPVGQLIVASGRAWTGFAMNLGWAAVFAACTLLLARRTGADGLAAARLLAYLAHSLWTFGFAVRQAPGR